MKQIILVVLSLLILQISAKSQAGLVKVGDERRQFIVYQPPSIDDSTPVPLLFNFHGYGMTSGEQMMYSKTNELAEKNGFIVVYPQGIDNDWNVGFDQDYDNGSKDVDFVEVLIEKLAKHYPVDTNQVFAIGLSRGGFFVQRLAAELSNKIHGIVSVGAPMPVEVHKRMPSKIAMKAMYVHGDADEIVAMDGDKEHYLSVQESIDFWEKSNKISKEKVFDEDSNDGTSAKLISHKGKAKIAMLLIENGGHTWPGADPFNIGLPLGKTTQDLDFNEVFWDFLINSSKK